MQWMPEQIRHDGGKFLSWVVYILECGDGSLYTGITNDLAKRLAAHELGKGAKYTKGRGPLRLVYQEDYEDRSDASKRERIIKKMSRAEKQNIFNDISQSRF